ncbi:TM2 domain-containing protein [Aliarcobacter skirrowii]|uniref:TM2 domain-containing protein n=1 Tax=Aliarcobacter skirrowii TaxID=28200 RepID=UPI0029B91423|nr:TM2 domain-containing protein [Aliarcobacter skirrowii]MDX4064515.1 TM2 domain-containing protein [Aliarcobacter skirrowii]
MKGKVLDYSIQESKGIISGDDGQRYTFISSEWKSNISPKVNQVVDFEVDGTNAKGIYANSASSYASGSSSSKIVAGILAILLGGLGVHKFYLGCTTAGIIMLLVFIFGFILLGLPSLIIAVIAFIEGLIYLFKSDDDFEQTYVNNKKCWF